MQPIQVTVRDLPKSPALEDHIRKKANKLSHYCRRINSCRIVITIPQKHKHQGKLYNVCIDVTVPGKELVANRQKAEDLYVAIRDAFNAIERQLEEYSRIRRGHVKTHEAGSRGVISRMFVDEGYGFIQGVDGNEVYFSLANVSNTRFEQLKMGDFVEYLTEPASDGLQARHVTKEKSNNFVSLEE